MPEYKYNCSQCGKKYSEFRNSTDSQWVANCDLCGAVYVEA